MQKLVPLLAALVLAGPAWAQSSPPSSQALNSPGCVAAAGRAEAATQPRQGGRDGTAPGNAGSTGWSGGTGGSFIGTNTAGATSASRTWQPPTARGLDPISAPKPAERVC